MIDVSNGYGCLDFPNIDDVVRDPEDLAGVIAAVNILENSFVHPHWLAVDPRLNALLISGEHTGNVDTSTRLLKQVEPVSIFNTGLENSPSADCEIGIDQITGLPTGAPDDLEPHAHGLQIDPQTGDVYVSDEGEHCFYEAVIIRRP